MRIIYDKKTKEVRGVIQGQTDFLPEMGVDDNTDFIETPTDLGGKELLGKILVTKQGEYSFKDKVPTKERAIVVDLENPKLHKDVATYTKKAEQLGAVVEIDDANARIKASIKVKGKEVGYIFLVKWGCCHYIYQMGKVLDRDFYPHYIGFSKLIEYLKDKNVKILDMGGYAKDEDINKFKLKFGKEKFVSY